MLLLKSLAKQIPYKDDLVSALARNNSTLRTPQSKDKSSSIFASISENQASKLPFSLIKNFVFVKDKIPKKSDVSFLTALLPKRNSQNQDSSLYTSLINKGITIRIAAAYSYVLPTIQYVPDNITPTSVIYTDAQITTTDSDEFASLVDYGDTITVLTANAIEIITGKYTKTLTDGTVEDFTGVKTTLNSNVIVDVDLGTITTTYPDSTVDVVNASTVFNFTGVIYTDLGSNRSTYYTGTLRKINNDGSLKYRTGSTMEFTIDPTDLATSGNTIFTGRNIISISKNGTVDITQGKVYEIYDGETVATDITDQIDETNPDIQESLTSAFITQNSDGSATINSGANTTINLDGTVIFNTGANITLNPDSSSVLRTDVLSTANNDGSLLFDYGFRSNISTSGAVTSNSNRFITKIDQNGNISTIPTGDEEVKHFEASVKIDQVTNKVHYNTGAIRTILPNVSTTFQGGTKFEINNDTIKITTGSVFIVYKDGTFSIKKGLESTLTASSAVKTIFSDPTYNSNAVTQKYNDGPMINSNQDGSYTYNSGAILSITTSVGDTIATGYVTTIYPQGQTIFSTGATTLFDISGEITEKSQISFAINLDGSRNVLLNSTNHYIGSVTVDTSSNATIYNSGTIISEYPALKIFKNGTKIAINPTGDIVFTTGSTTTLDQDGNVMNTRGNRNTLLSTGTVVPDASIIGIVNPIANTGVLIIESADGDSTEYYFGSTTTQSEIGATVINSGPFVNITSDDITKLHTGQIATINQDTSTVFETGAITVVGSSGLILQENGFIVSTNLSGNSTIVEVGSNILYYPGTVKTTSTSTRYSTGTKQTSLPDGSMILVGGAFVSLNTDGTKKFVNGSTTSIDSNGEISIIAGETTILSSTGAHLPIPSDEFPPTPLPNDVVIVTDDLTTTMKGITISAGNDESIEIFSSIQKFVYTDGMQYLIKGPSMKMLPDGSVVIKSGSEIQTFPDGVVQMTIGPYVTITEDLVATRTEQTFLNIYSDRTVAINPDQIIIENADGSTTTIDGETITTYNDGTEIITRGLTRITEVDGKTTTILSTSITTNPDGSVIEVNGQKIIDDPNASLTTIFAETLYTDANGVKSSSVGYMKRENLVNGNSKTITGRTTYVDSDGQTIQTTSSKMNNKANGFIKKETGKTKILDEDGNLINTYIGELKIVDGNGLYNIKTGISTIITPTSEINVIASETLNETDGTITSVFGEFTSIESDGSQTNIIGKKVVTKPNGTIITTDAQTTIVDSDGTKTDILGEQHIVNEDGSETTISGTLTITDAENSVITKLIGVTTTTFINPTIRASSIYKQDLIQSITVEGTIIITREDGSSSEILGQQTIINTDGKVTVIAGKTTTINSNGSSEQIIGKTTIENPDGTSKVISGVINTFDSDGFLVSTIIGPTITYELDSLVIEETGSITINNPDGTQIIITGPITKIKDGVIIEVIPGSIYPDPHTDTTTTTSDTTTTTSDTTTTTSDTTTTTSDTTTTTTTTSDIKTTSSSECTPTSDTTTSSSEFTPTFDTTTTTCDTFTTIFTSDSFTSDCTTRACSTECRMQGNVSKAEFTKYVLETIRYMEDNQDLVLIPQGYRVIHSIYHAAIRNHASINQAINFATHSLHNMFNFTLFTVPNDSNKTIGTISRGLIQWLSLPSYERLASVSNTNYVSKPNLLDHFTRRSINDEFDCYIRFYDDKNVRPNVQRFFDSIKNLNPEEAVLIDSHTIHALIAGSYVPTTLLQQKLYNRYKTYAKLHYLLSHRCRPCPKPRHCPEPKPCPKPRRCPELRICSRPCPEQRECPRPHPFPVNPKIEGKLSKKEFISGVVRTIKEITENDEIVLSKKSYQVISSIFDAAIKNHLKIIQTTILASTGMHNMHSFVTFTKPDLNDKTIGETARGLLQFLAYPEYVKLSLVSSARYLSRPYLLDFFSERSISDEAEAYKKYYDNSAIIRPFERFFDTVKSLGPEEAFLITPCTIKALVNGTYIPCTLLEKRLYNRYQIFVRLYANLTPLL